MKKVFVTLLFSLFLIAGCTNNTETEVIQETINQDNINIEQDTQQPDIYETFKDIVKQQENCGDGSEMFIDIAILGSSEKDNGNIEYYLVSNGEGYKIDERGNLSNTCGFGIPVTIELSQDENGYNLVRYELAKDGSLYDSSIKEMFSEEAYKKQRNGDYTYINNKTLLEQAEEHFGIKIIPENENKFECTFCDKLRYYNAYDNDEINTNGLIFNYTTQNNGNNTIYFSSDGSFEAKGSRDEGTGTRTFGQDENTIIVLNNNIDHVYDRYIITHQSDNSLSTILEIIQRR